MPSTDPHRPPPLDPAGGDAAARFRLEWARGNLGELTAANRAVVDEVSRLIKAGGRETLVAALKGWPPSHLVELFVQLPLKHARTLFGWVDTYQARAVAELDDAFRDALLADTTVERMAAVLNALEPEEARAALLEFPPAVHERVLPLLHHREAVEALGLFIEDSAGSIMSRRFVAVPPEWTVDQTIREIRAHAAEIVRLYAVYVVDAERRPLGYLRLRDLLLTPHDVRVREVMSTDFIAVGPDTDQEDVARIADRHELSVVPVVDREGRLIGRITPERLGQVIRDEAQEDMLRMGGLSVDTRPDESVGRIVKGRIPWLLVGLAGASLSAAVVGAFEEQLAQAAILASFIPIVMSSAGNAGIQASTVAVQGLTSGAITFGDIGWRLGKELTAALTNGAIAAAVLMALVAVLAQFTELRDPWALAITAGLALMTVITLAVAVGATIPLILDRIGIDPAMATGVFITTGNDIMAVAVFFLMVSLFYL
jgi:magnesium transporter